MKQKQLVRKLPRPQERIQPQPFALPPSSLPPKVLAAIREECPEDFKKLEDEGLFSLPITNGNVVTKEMKRELLDKQEKAKVLAKQYRKIATMLRDPALAFSWERSVPDDMEIEHMEKRARELDFAAEMHGKTLRQYPRYPNYANQRIRHLVSEILKYKPDFNRWEELANVNWVALRAMGIKVHDPADDARTAERQKPTNLSAGAMRKEAKQIRKKEKGCQPQ